MVDVYVFVTRFSMSVKGYLQSSTLRKSMSHVLRKYITEIDLLAHLDLFALIVGAPSNDCRYVRVQLACVDQRGIDATWPCQFLHHGGLR